MKYQEVTGGASGLLLMVLIVVLALQGLGQQMTIGNIVLGLAFLAIALIVIGGGIFFVLVFCFSRLKIESDQKQNLDDNKF